MFRQWRFPVLFEHKTSPYQKWFNLLIKDPLLESSEAHYYCDFDTGFTNKICKIFPGGTSNWENIWGGFYEGELSENKLIENIISVLMDCPENTSNDRTKDSKYILCGSRVSPVILKKIKGELSKPETSFYELHDHEKLNDNFVYILPEPEYLGCFYHCAKRGWGMFVITTFIRKMTPEQFLEQIS